MADPIVRRDIEQYAAAHTTPEPDWLATVAEETRANLGGKAGMLTGRLEGQLLSSLTFALGARRVLEIGTFTGYSALSMVRGMPEDGTIVTCEVDPEHAEIARRNIAASPYADRIEVRLAPALETIAALEGPFDLVFIDADKDNYPAYYEAVLPKLAGRGLIAADNTLWSGRVLDESDTSADSVAIRAFNDRVRNDDRVECVQLTVRDGLTLIRKK